MAKYISVGTYGIPKSKKNQDEDTEQLGLAYGISYLPNYSLSKVIVDFHKKSNIKKINDQYYNLELNIDEAKTLSNVLRNLVNHLEGKISLAKKEMLKDECYYDDSDDDETF